jgi:hypothetical protein
MIVCIIIGPSYGRTDSQNGIHILKMADRDYPSWVIQSQELLQDGPSQLYHSRYKRADG